MATLTLDDLEYDKKYTLFFLEGFGTKMTVYYNATCVFKNETGAGFTTLLEGYKFVTADRIHQEVRNHNIVVTFEDFDNE